MRYLTIVAGAAALVLATAMTMSIITKEMETNEGDMDESRTSKEERLAELTNRFVWGPRLTKEEAEEFVELRRWEDEEYRRKLQREHRRQTECCFSCEPRFLPLAPEDAHTSC